MTWSRKVAIFKYTGSWVRWARTLGKEKVFSDLRAILKNGAMQGRFVDEYNRFLLGEVWLNFISSVYFKMAKDKGVPAAWQHLDYSEVQNFSVVVQKTATHPNAAKLVAVYLASPEGAKFTLDGSGAGNLYYPGNFEHEISQQAKKQGVPRHSMLSYPGMIDFHFTKEYGRWRKEVKLILETGGKR